MNSSGYYDSQYRSYNRQVKKYKGQRAELEKIEKAFSSRPVGNDPDDYNKRLKKALDAQSKALTGDKKFDSLYKALEAKKEKAVLDDTNLNTAHMAIVKEIRSLNNQITNTQQKADQSWRNKQTALYQEQADT